MQLEKFHKYLIGKFKNLISKNASTTQNKTDQPKNDQTQKDSQLKYEYECDYYCS